MINALIDSKLRVHATAPANFAVIEIAKRFRNLFPEKKILIVGNLSRLKLSDDLLAFHYETKLKKIKDSVTMFTNARDELIILLRLIMNPESDPPENARTDVIHAMKQLEISLKVLKAEAPEGMLSESVEVDVDIHAILKYLTQLSLNDYLAWFEHLRRPRSSVEATRPAMLKISKYFIQLIQYVRGINLNREIISNLQSILLLQVDVCFSTVNVGGRKIFSLVRTDVVIIDEASQLLPGDVATMFRSEMRCLVLVGDEKQLPAVVQSEKCRYLGYDLSLFDRLIKLNYPFTMLNVQYRMHPLISSWPSQRFYGNNIQDSDSVISSAYTKSWHEKIRPLELFDIREGEETSDGTSLYHEIQAAIVRKIITSVMKITSASGEQSLSIGVISPYKQQVAILSDLTKETSKLTIKVCTVDGFQGQEADIIIFTTVRSNCYKKIGFVKDWRRLNVAITRSKYSMIVVGDVETMSSNPDWDSYLNHVKGYGRTYSLDTRAVTRLITNSGDSIQLFQSSLEEKMILWSVNYSKHFEEYLSRPINDHLLHKKVLRKIYDFSCGIWPRERRESFIINEQYVNIIHIHRIDKLYYLLWSVDVDRTSIKCIQCLKIWYLVNLNEVQNSIRNIENSFRQYSEHYLKCCVLKPSSNQITKKYEPNLIQNDENIAWYRSGKV
jgi:hypothetical protein